MYRRLTCGIIIEVSALLYFGSFGSAFFQIARIYLASGRSKSGDKAVLVFSLHGWFSDNVLVFGGKQKFAFSRIALSVMSESRETMQNFALNSPSRTVDSQAHDGAMQRVHADDHGMENARRESDGLNSERINSDRNDNVEEEGSSILSQGSELQDMYSSQEMKSALEGLFETDSGFLFNFPDSFTTMPTLLHAERIWLVPITRRDLMEKLSYYPLQMETQTGRWILSEPVITYFNDFVKWGSAEISDLLREAGHNERHIRALERGLGAKSCPSWTKLQMPKIQFLAEGSLAKRNIEAKLKAKSEEWSRTIIEIVLGERRATRDALPQRTAQLRAKLREEAMARWMNAQGFDINRCNTWDHNYQVINSLNNRTPVPLSSVIFEMMLFAIKSEVSKQQELNRQRLAEEQRMQRQEQDKRRSAQTAASLLPRQEAEKTLEQTVVAKIAPLAEAVARLEAKLDGSLKNAKPLVSADSSGAKGQSAHAQFRKRSHPKKFGNDTTQTGEQPGLMASDDLQKKRKKAKMQQREIDNNRKAGPTQVNVGNYRQPPSGQATPPGDRARSNGTGGRSSEARAGRWKHRKHKGRVDRQ